MTCEHLIIIVSALGGVIGGMGMGGGTLLIPLLTFAAGIEQHLAQSINLIAFLPMSIVALFIHKKKGYVVVKRCIPIMFFAILGVIFGSLLSFGESGDVLRMCYGIFVGVLGIIQAIKTAISVIKNIKAERRRQKSAVQLR